MKEKKIVLEQIEMFENEFEKSFEEFVIETLQEAEEKSYIIPGGNKERLQKKYFSCNIVKVYERRKMEILMSIKELEKELEIIELNEALEELEEFYPVKTGKQVAKDNIRQQIILINLFDQDEVLIKEYERLFGLNLNKMTAEEIDQIDLSTLAGDF